MFLKAEKTSSGMKAMLLLPNLKVNKLVQLFRLDIASRQEDLSERFINNFGLRSVISPSFTSD